MFILCQSTSKCTHLPRYLEVRFCTDDEKTAYRTLFDNRKIMSHVFRIQKNEHVELKAANALFNTDLMDLNALIEKAKSFKFDDIVEQLEIEKDQQENEAKRIEERLERLFKMLDNSAPCNMQL